MQEALAVTVSAGTGVRTDSGRFNPPADRPAVSSIAGIHYDRAHLDLLGAFAALVFDDVLFFIQA